MNRTLDPHLFSYMSHGIRALNLAMVENTSPSSTTSSNPLESNPSQFAN